MKSNFILFLKRELHRRIERNPNYSLRAFAKKLGVSSGTLCDLFQNKRTLSLKNFDKIITHFELSENQIGSYREWVENNAEGLATFTELPEKQATIFGSPRFAAIVELLNLKKFQESPKLLAQALNIEEKQCLHELKMLVENQIIDEVDGTYVANAANYFSINGFPKSFFKDVIEKAHDDINQLDPNEHICIAAAYAIKADDLNEFKKKLLNCHSELTHWNEFRQDKDSVYFLNINFSPL